MACSHFLEACLYYADKARVAGGLGLQGLVEHLVSLLEKIVAQGKPVWQCQAASVITVLTEVVFGASPAWHPVKWLDAACQRPTGTVVLPLVEQLQEGFFQDKLWGVPSQNNAQDADAPKLSPQVPFLSL